MGREKWRVMGRRKNRNRDTDRGKAGGRRKEENINGDHSKGKGEKEKKQNGNGDIGRGKAGGEGGRSVKRESVMLLELNFAGMRTDGYISEGLIMIFA